MGTHLLHPEAFGIETAMANFYASLPKFGMVFLWGIVAGWILDRTKNRKAVLATSLTAAAVILIWCFRLGSVSVVVPYMIGLGLIVSFIQSSFLTL